MLTALCVVPRVDVARQAESDERAAARLAADAPPCFGAAARDPRATECPNPELEDVLVPAPAAVEKDYPKYQRCIPPAEADPLQPCRFGKRTSKVPHVAVIGDSHARIMMTMVEPLVEARKLTADLFVSGGCPWSTYEPNLSHPRGAHLRRLPRAAVHSARPNRDGLRRRAHHCSAHHHARNA